jgi:hypothetical protein
MRPSSRPVVANGFATVSRGVREAIGYISVCAGLGAVAALVWLVTFGGQFVPHLGVCLIAAGGLVSVTGGQLATRYHMADVNAWVGIDSRSTSEEIPYGALTSVGVFLFVSIPLIAVGLVIV